MEQLTVRSPATWWDCVDMGGSRAYTRKANIYMRSKGDSLAISDGDQLLALAFLCRDDLGRLEFALAIKPDASRHMRRLCRLAHLTLGGIAETGTVIICHVMTGNETGARMARLVGFVPSEGTMWIFSGASDDKHDLGIVRRGQLELGGDEGGGAVVSAAAGGE
ncbi:hypothetical protein [Rhizobium sp. ICMP 5592]|uniref:hypothetical protein n=1 Tax=Rhizobium sp. ICMP 5592 TaxID=2292445 RepID=UPI0012974CF8|nr:hypothetical protein [Rhizobium sp. ICMP 5592]MQB43380.1 hypothetical protein [Rhizobium sp. ICMP 5592]